MFYDNAGNVIEMHEHKGDFRKRYDLSTVWRARRLPDTTATARVAKATGERLPYNDIAA